MKALIVMTVLSMALIAKAQTPPPAAAENNSVKPATEEVRKDKMEVQNDVAKLHADKKSGASKEQLMQDHQAIKADRKELKEEQIKVNADKKEMREDKKEMRKKRKQKS